MLLVKRWEAECLAEGWVFSEHVTKYHGFLVFLQALQVHCNRVVRSCSDSAEVGWTLLTAVAGLVGSAASLSSGFHLLCFKVSAPGISLFNLQLKAKFQKKSQRRRKRTLPPEQIKILKWVVLRNWDMTGSCCMEVDNQQSHFLSMACSAGALGASTVRIRMQRGNVQNLR